MNIRGKLQILLLLPSRLVEGPIAYGFSYATR